MKSITIHDLDESLEAGIEAKAREQGLSLNKTVKMLLRQALGLEPSGNGKHKADFAEFSGLWSQAEMQEFERNTRDLREVDARDWQ
ncbi:MAG: hypothetical protein FJ280_04885 [Planctomycetes bacterium]|nr:hypothetical protein [Planctomycetota bacterium]